MEPQHSLDISIKKEPLETPLEDEDAAQAGLSRSQSTESSSAVAASPAPLRYVSRRGRPPGGGYSMKAPTHYVRFSSTPLTGGSSSSSSGSSDTTSAVSDLSPQRIMQLAGGPAGISDSFELGRFGIHAGFDAEKNSFRCEGCDVVFSSRDTYAMHMLLRAKNESCVALPTSSISANPENPTPREKFERELRQKAMITALRSQAEAMSKAAAALLPKTLLQESLPPQSPTLVSAPGSVAPPSIKDESSRMASRGGSTGSNSFSGVTERSVGFNSLLALDAYSLYMDPSQYRRFLAEYGFRASSSAAAAMSNSTLAAMMEQLACGVCGELFSNKDALAMHMMFHTREECDGEELRAKLRMRGSWMPDSSTFPSTNQLMMGQSALSVSVSKSSSAPETNNNSKSVSGREDNKREERQLTAERVAELKRMAIESSLKASATQMVRAGSSQRPRSVSEDSTVTSTAQPRPLSADDARRLAMSSSARGSFALNKTMRSYSTDTRPYRKRHSSNRESCLSSSYTFRNQISLRKIGRWDSIKTGPSHSRSGSFKVCDNHVSSATGPQDSDETSQESPTFNHGAYQANDPASYVSTESSTFHGRAGKGFPYLDAIMSHEAELVPVDGLETENDNDEREEAGNERGKSHISGESPGGCLEKSGGASSAIDFSLGTLRKEGNTRSCSGRERYVGENGGLSYSTSSSSSFTEMYGHNGSEAQRASASPRFPPTMAASFSSATPTPASGTSALEPPSLAPPSRVGEARYCPHCEILFLDVTLFHLHMGLHNVNNPWQCNTCGLACSGRLEFNTHVLHY